MLMGVQLASILVTMAGCFGLMGGPFPMPTFFVAGALLYMGTIVLEALSMSLCSKARLLPNLRLVSDSQPLWLLPPSPASS